MMKHEVDLHALANSGGYGSAKAVLQKAGLWDEASAADGEKQMLFVVKVRGTYEPQLETETVEVIAACKEDAIEKAWDEAGFDEVHDAEVVKVQEVSS